MNHREVKLFSRAGALRHTFIKPKALIDARLLLHLWGRLGLRLKTNKLIHAPRMLQVMDKERYSRSREVARLAHTCWGPIRSMIHYAHVEASDCFGFTSSLLATPCTQIYK